MWDLTQIRLVGQTNGSVSPWKRAGSSSGKPRGENLYLFLSSKLTSSLQHTKIPVTAQTPTYITPSQLVTATNMAWGLTWRLRGNKMGYYKSQRLCKMLNAWDCLSAFVWINSTSYTFTQAIHPDRMKQHTLTLPGVSSTSDKGRTDSHTAQVRTGQPAAETASLLVPSLAANHKGLDTQSQICFWCLARRYNAFQHIEYKTSYTPTSLFTVTEFSYFCLTMSVHHKQNTFCVGSLCLHSTSICFLFYLKCH